MGSDGWLVVHTAALLSWLRTDAYIGDVAQYPDQTDLVLLGELTHKLHTVFEDVVVKTRSGYWLKEYILTSTINRGRYRIPPRAVVGGLEKIEVAPNGVYYTLTEISPEDAQAWEGSLTVPSTGSPQVFVVMGDQIEMYPAPNLAIPIRMTYYVRPSILTASQNNQVWYGVTGGTDRGRITAVNTTARTVTVNALPFDNSLSSPAAITTALQSVDIVHADGWHELAMVSQTQTISTLTLTLGGTDDMTDVQVGDYVRAADQTDWPCLPDDFHRCLADVAAIKVAIEIGTREKGDELAGNVENDLIRFRSLLAPRVKSEPKTTPVSLKSRGWGWGAGNGWNW